MIIPVNFQAVAHFFGGGLLPNGAAVTYATPTSGSHTPTTAALDLHDAFADHIMPELSDSVQLERTRVKYGPNASGPFAESGGSVQGGSASAGFFPQAAFLVEKNTAVGGKSGKGRMYLPGVGNAHVTTGGEIASATRTALLTAVAAWLDAIELLFSEMVLLHTASSDPTTVTSLTVDPQVATQRRRNRD